MAKKTTLSTSAVKPPAKASASAEAAPKPAAASNGRMRDGLLNETLFTSLAHAREAVASWADDYNAERPHSSLGYATPAAYAVGTNTKTHLA